MAGILDVPEAKMLCAAGVDWLGIPLRLPVHTEDVTDDEAAAIFAALPPNHAGILITYLDRAEEIVALCRKLDVTRVQLHGTIEQGELRGVRQAAPELFVLKSLVVHQDNEAQLVRTVHELAPWVDGFITDTFDPDTGAEGATGMTHDWAISRRLVELSPLPVVLAGGLTPDNVRAAICHVRPAGIDAHTGVETPSGRKDEAIVTRFVREARAGFAVIA